MFPLNLYLMDSVLVQLSLNPFLGNIMCGTIFELHCLISLVTLVLSLLTEVCSSLYNKLEAALLNWLSYFGFINLIEIFSRLLNKWAAARHFNHQLALPWVTFTSNIICYSDRRFKICKLSFFFIVTLDCLNGLKVLCVSPKVMSCILHSIPINLKSFYLESFLP